MRALQAVFDAAGVHAAGWWALPTINLTASSGMSDIDILVGVPNSGLLIVEVKGWTKFSVEDDGTWTYPGKNGVIKRHRGPYEQSTDQIFLLKGLLRTLRSRDDLSMGNLPRVGSGVLFGNLRTSDTDRDGWAQDWERTLFADTWSVKGVPSEQDARGTLQRLRHVLSANPEIAFSDNSPARLAEIRDVLAPRRSVVSLALEVSASHDQLNYVSENSMTARAEVELEAGRVFYVVGAAGTGKTVLALQMAELEARRSGLQSLFICFSPHLAEELRGGAHVDPDLVRTFTPEELLIAHGGQAALDALKDAEQAGLAAAQALFAATGTPGVPELPRAYLGADAFWTSVLDAVAASGHDYGAVVIDEAQDLWEPAFDALASLVPTAGLFAVFCDPLQSTRRERAGVSWGRPASTLGGQTRELDRNYRNGDKIIDSVEEAFKIVYRRPERGAPPGTIEAFAYSARDPLIGVVTREHHRLTTAGLTPQILTTGMSDEALAALDSTFETRTVDSFKGLERRVVLLVIGQNSSPLDPTNEDLYVGMTRATVHLTIVHHASFVDNALPRPPARAGELG